MLKNVQELFWMGAVVIVLVIKIYDSFNRLKISLKLQYLQLPLLRYMYKLIIL